MERVPMLAEGYEKLTADLQMLRQERPKIVDAIEEARAHGDLSENAEYHAAKERQGQVEAQIAEIEDRVTRAQIIDPPRRFPAIAWCSAPPSPCSTRTTRTSATRSSARPKPTPARAASPTFLPSAAH